MELLYVWVDWFNNINNQAFHFSNEYNIDFNLELRRLDISPGNETSANLFNNSFLNITALIGRNGSGKTSLFSLLKTVFSDSFFHFDNYIIVVKRSDNNLLVIDRFSKKDENIIEEQKLENGHHLQLLRSNESIYNSVNLITHSNSFSVYEKDTYGSHFLDISFNKTLDFRSVKSNRLLIERYESLQKYYQDKPGKEKDFNDSKESIIRNTLPRDFIYQYDLMAKVNFITKYKEQREQWKFIPRFLDLSFNQLFFYSNKQYFEKIGLSEKLNDFEFLLFRQQADHNSKENSISQFKDRIIISLFLYFTVHDQYYHPRNEGLKTVIATIVVTEDINGISAIIKGFILKSKETNKEHPLKKIKDFVIGMDNEFNKFESFEASFSNNYSFHVSDALSKTLNQIFSIWLDNDFIFSFSWQGLSAGESALLTIFARISSISEFHFYETIWLLIDEGDLYLHPEWQRTFFFDLHKYLPSFFNGKKIQLFLTSHSPFIISDLPKENIILMDRDDEGRGKITQEDIGNTFAANIHSILTKPFFMDSSIGKFAEIRIKKLIKFLESVENEEILEDGFMLNKYSSLSLTNLIGEDLLKESLTNMCKDKFLDKESRQININLALLNKIESLENELKNK